MNDTVEISFPDSNRIGKFSVLHEILGDGRELTLLSALLALCARVDENDTYAHESGRGMTFIRASPLFQPLTEGEEIPEYRIEVAWPDQAFKNPEHEQDCLRSRGFRFRAVRQIIVRVPPASINVKPGTPFH